MSTKQVAIFTAEKSRFGNFCYCCINIPSTQFLYQGSEYTKAGGLLLHFHSSVSTSSATVRLMNTEQQNISLTGGLINS